MIQILKRLRLTIWQTVAVAAVGLLIFIIAGLYGISLMAQPPDNLGVTNGRLAPCPESPNCVCSQATDPQHAMRPLSFTGDASAALGRLETIVGQMPGGRVVERSDNYLRAEFTSFFFRFVDDVEFYVPDDEGVIHFRSASRSGYSDLGANRRRMEQIAFRLAEDNEQKADGGAGR